MTNKLLFGKASGHSVFRFSELYRVLKGKALRREGSGSPIPSFTAVGEPRIFPL